MTTRPGWPPGTPPGAGRTVPARRTCASASCWPREARGGSSSCPCSPTWWSSGTGGPRPGSSSTTWWPGRTGSADPALAQRVRAATAWPAATVGRRRPGRPGRADRTGGRCRRAAARGPPPLRPAPPGRHHPPGHAELPDGRSGPPGRGLRAVAARAGEPGAPGPGVRPGPGAGSLRHRPTRRSATATCRPRTCCGRCSAAPRCSSSTATTASASVPMVGPSRRPGGGGP